MDDEFRVGRSQGRPKDFWGGHSNNPNASWLSVLSNGLGGVMYALAFLGTRRIWMSWGLHLAWNFVPGPVFGFPISGTADFSRAGPPESNRPTAPDGWGLRSRGGSDRHRLSIRGDGAGTHLLPGTRTRTASKRAKCFRSRVTIVLISRPSIHAAL